jgi:hypothetical protein
MISLEVIIDKIIAEEVPIGLAVVLYLIVKSKWHYNKCFISYFKENPCLFIG